MAASNQISGVKFILSTTICLLSSAMLTQAVARAGLNRNQRQTIAGELATGLTGTGTSFNSLYNINNLDQYQFQQQSILDQPGVLGDTSAYAGRRPVGSGSFTGGYNVNRYDGVYNDPLSPTYTQGGVGSSWSGFGYGKSGRGSGGGRLPVGGANGGVKY